MTTSRRGKIARLPQHIRAQLNRRLEDGEQGKELLAWLSALPEVKAVLAGQFGDRPITEQNLSEWRQGGYQDWLRHQESCEQVRRMAEEADDLEAVADEVAGEVAVSDRLAPILAAELARTAKALLEEDTTPPEHWRRLQEVLRELSDLRRHDHRAARLRRDQAVWEREEERLDAEAHQRRKEAIKDKVLAPFRAGGMLSTLAGCYGGGAAGQAKAAYVLEVVNELPSGTLNRKPAAAPAEGAEPGQTGSSPVQPRNLAPKAPPPKPPIPPGSGKNNTNLTLDRAGEVV